MKSKGDQFIEKNFKTVNNVKEGLKILDKKDVSVKKKKPYKQKKLTKKQIEEAKKKVSDSIKPLNIPKQKEVKNDYPSDEDIYEKDVILVDKFNDKKGGKHAKAIRIKRKIPYITAYSSILPQKFARLEYTPEELRYKFIERVKRSEMNGEEIVISGFQLYAQVGPTFLWEKQKSQVFSDVTASIFQYFEMMGEQKAFKGENISYWLNNRFKGKWESNQKVETTQNINPEIKDILDQIIYGKATDGTTKQ